MKISIPSHYVLLTFDSFGNFKHISVAAKEKQALYVKLTSSEKRELQQAYQVFIDLEHEQLKAQAMQAMGTNSPKEIRLPYRLVLDASNPLTLKIQSQESFSNALPRHEDLRMNKLTVNQGVIKRLNSLEDLPFDLKKRVGEFLTFEAGKGLLGVNKASRESVINRHYALLRPAELALVMDITGSMSSQLEEAQFMLGTILRTLNHSTLPKGFYQRSAWLGYRDLQDQEPFHLKDFSTDPSVISRYIQKTIATGGGDIPEDVAGAMYLLLNDLSWTDNPYAYGLKNAIWVLDAPPHGMGVLGDDYPNGTPNRDWLALAHRMNKRGVVVHPVICGEGVNSPELNLFATTVAEITGGTSVQLTMNDETRTLSLQIISCINRDIELQQAVEIDMNNRLLRLHQQSQSLEITPTLIASLAAEAVGALSESAAYQITQLPGLQLPLTDRAEQLSRCYSQPEARAVGLLPAGSDVRSLLPPVVPLEHGRVISSLDDLFNIPDNSLLDLPDDFYEINTNIDEVKALPGDSIDESRFSLDRMMSQGGSVHYLNTSIKGYGKHSADEHLSSAAVKRLKTLPTIDEDSMVQSDDETTGVNLKRVSTLSTRALGNQGLFARHCSEPLPRLSSSSISEVNQDELRRHAKRAANCIQRSMSTDVQSDFSQMFIG